MISSAASWCPRCRSVSAPRERLLVRGGPCQQRTCQRTLARSAAFRPRSSAAGAPHLCRGGRGLFSRAPGLTAASDVRASPEFRRTSAPNVGCAAAHVVRRGCAVASDVATMTTVACGSRPACHCVNRLAGAAQRVASRV
ncbi:hypothetical protein DB32_003929 [Sandaracinus amylolyticus]|uniref:Uncharacterized protein n=1 Tax=Sandaracinus amylolyticus TaxID=927083 RepID=A0A0F6W3X8_9BACT|nr:hypothetical protein DB32_003929 [Sandaracinus amylolyticus]